MKGLTFTLCLLIVFLATNAMAGVLKVRVVARDTSACCPAGCTVEVPALVVVAPPMPVVAPATCAPAACAAVATEGRSRPARHAVRVVLKKALPPYRR